MEDQVLHRENGTPSLRHAASGFRRICSGGHPHFLAVTGTLQPPRATGAPSALLFPSTEHTLHRA